MPNIEPDLRSERRKALDEQIAAEPPRPARTPQPGERPRPVEELLRAKVRQPIAVLGVVENGLVRPLDPAVILPEHSQVIIVAAQH